MILLFTESAFAFVYREVLGPTPPTDCAVSKRKAGMLIRLLVKG